MGHHLTAVVVVRKGSKRIPDKGKQLINGETLVERKLKQLLKVKTIDKVVLGSDDVYWDGICDKLGVEFKLRDEVYCDEVSSTPNDMVRDMLSKIMHHSEYVLWAHPTNPFIDESQYSHAINQFHNAQEVGYDSLFSASRMFGHFWTEQTIPINYNPMSPVHVVAKDLPPVFSQNGGIFIRDIRSMHTDGAFIGHRPYMMQMQRITGWDIDEPWELEFAQAYASK